VRTLLLAANHPYVEKTLAQQQVIDSFQRSNPSLWKRLSDPRRQPEDSWDLMMRGYEPEEASREMATLGQQLDQMLSTSMLERYAFVATKRLPSTYVTANFLHAGWLHLIFNLWFLWLAGSVLEDAWGRIIYPMFYFAGGAFALWAQATSSPHSIVPVVGASGAVAALMGAFLVRYFKTKIQFLFIWFFGFYPRFWRFKSPAYFMLPLWLGTQLFWAAMDSEGGGIAYWAHIGGFGFGVAVALGMKHSGLEKKVDKAIEQQVGWTADERVVRAGEMLVANPNGAVAELEAVAREKPDSMEAWEMLERAYWQKQDFEHHRQALATLVRLHVKQKDMDGAWQRYEEFVSGGGEKLPAAEWMQMCRWLESKQNWDRAALEYEKYARAYVSERMSVYALVAAARIQMKNLNNRSEAARLYREAEKSPVPHLDWDDAIRRGLREATSPEPVAAR
jgi:membrane associated rhomboid family serine protease